MRWLSLTSFALLVACGVPEVQQQKLKDGSWKFECELSMDECIRKVEETCPNQRYRILEGTSETRLRDAPPFERAFHTSRLHLVCSNDGGSPLLSLGSGGSAAVPGAAPEAAKPAASQVCSAGQTRECVGPAACKGGQTCLPDGAGFGACDCGPAPAATAPAAPADVPVVPAPVPAAPPAPATPR